MRILEICTLNFDPKVSKVLFPTNGRWAKRMLPKRKVRWILTKTQLRKQNKAVLSFFVIRTLSLARSYEQRHSKDRPKTDQRPTKDWPKNKFFWNCKDVVLSFWYDLWYRVTAYGLGQTGRRMGRGKTREPWVITELWEWINSKHSWKRWISWCLCMLFLANRVTKKRGLNCFILQGDFCHQL